MRSQIATASRQRLSQFKSYGFSYGFVSNSEKAPAVVRDDSRRRSLT
jgi:hypothetical protein